MNLTECNSDWAEYSDAISIKFKSVSNSHMPIPKSAQLQKKRPRLCDLWVYGRAVLLYCGSSHGFQHTALLIRRLVPQSNCRVSCSHSNFSTPKRHSLPPACYSATAHRHRPRGAGIYNKKIDQRSLMFLSSRSKVSSNEFCPSVLCSVGFLSGLV